MTFTARVRPHCVSERQPKMEMELTRCSSQTRDVCVPRSAPRLAGGGARRLGNEFLFSAPQPKRGPLGRDNSYVNKKAIAKLEALRSDFQSVAGRPFDHFYCPILFRDEKTPLCRGHLVTSAFTGADRSWTIQRADVDAFFGSFFESEFVAIQERGKHDLLDVIKSPELSRLLRPKILVDGKEVEHYFPEGPVPSNHSEVSLHDRDRPTTRLALKLQTSEIVESLQARWQIGFTKDVRLSALVSLLRSAHLTLFELLGYQYALSGSGHFMGNEVLGKFFMNNVGKDKPTVLAAAKEHFPEFVNLVRPVLKSPPNLTGTSTDRLMYLCTGTPHAWAFLLFVRAGGSMHAVIVPILEEPEGAARFAAFLKEAPPRFEVKLARFKGDQWEVARDAAMFTWPAANFN